MSKLEAIEWPSSPGTYELRVHNKRIGHAAKVEDGWLVFGKRKPAPSLEMAAKQCIDKQISQHSNEIQKLRAMLATVLSHNVKVSGGAPTIDESAASNPSARP